MGGDGDESMDIDQSNTKSNNVVDNNDDGGVADNNDDGGDTDTEINDPGKEKEDDRPKLFRLSSRISSLKRRGKYLEPKEIKPEFDFFADDVVTVRGPDKSFWVCRILDDVLSRDTSINIAWYDVVMSDLHKGKLYKVSFDDTIYKATILMQIKLIEDEETGYYSIPKKFIAETNRLLKRSLQNEGTDMELNESDKGETASDDDVVTTNKLDVFDFPSEDDDEPTSKRRKLSNQKTPKQTKRSSLRRKSTTPKATPKKTGRKSSSKGSSPAKPNIRKGLIPNPEIKFLENDPLFEKKIDEIPLMVEKQGIQAVLLEDYEKLRELLEDKENVYTLHWTRSPHLKHGPIYYALMNKDRKALELFHEFENRRIDVKAKKREISLEKKSTGRYNFHTFGHAVREVTTSRGNKEGNNAFLKDLSEINETPDKLIGKCFKYNLPVDFILWYFETLTKKKNGDEFFDFMHIAVANGNRELAGEFMKKAVKTDAYGYNFLHEETLCYNTEQLTKFKSTSVTKKPYTDKYFFPLHCACINPNEKYLKELLGVLPEYNMPDHHQWSPIHYASVCTGTGPLKYLLSRGIDANLRNNMFTTPLMLAAKCGRDHNIDVLMKHEITIENDEGEPVKEKPVLINGKNKMTMTALHYAAKYGHVECVKKLIKHGALVDVQTGAVRENFTPLCFAVVKGHYDVVKALLNAGASPDKKTRRNKTALMYACMNGHSQIVAHLLRIGVNPNAVDSSENTPIHYAAAYGWYHCVQLLLEGGADPNVPNNWKTTPLAVALAMKQIEIGDLLLSAEVDVNYPDDQGQTILMSQIDSGITEEMFELVKFLVEKKKADVNRKDIKGWSALHFLAYGSVYENRTKEIYEKIDWAGSRRLEFVKEYSDVVEKVTDLLIIAGADVNAVSNDGETPLRLAVRQLNYLLAHQLLKHGADPNLGHDENGNGILHLIISHSYLHKEKNLDDVYPGKLPLSSSAENRKQLDEIFKEQSKKAFLILFEDFLKYDCSVDVVSKAGVTPLMCIIQEKIHEAIPLLLKKNFNPLLGKTDENENLLHFFAKHASAVFLLYLTDLAEKYTFSEEFSNMSNADGYTPIHLLVLQYNKFYDKEVGSWFCEYFQVYCSMFQCDITKCVGKAIRKENEKDKIFVACEDKECEKKYKDYKVYGLYSILHLLMLRNEPPGESPSIIDICLEKLGTNHALLHHKDRYGRTAFHALLNQRSYKESMVEYVLERFSKYGYDINLCSENKVIDHLAPPLAMIAMRSSCRHSVLRQIKLLVSKGADINIPDGLYNRSLLTLTTQFETDNHNLAIASYLIKAGININMRNTEGRTALHYAVDRNSGDYESLIEMENLLVENGARKDIMDNDKRLPLHYAFYALDKPDSAEVADPISVVTMLCDVEKKDLSSFDAGEEGFDKILSKYINQVDITGKSPLHYAAMKGATLSCSHLKKLNANDKLEDNDGNTPLAIALRGSHTGCAMTLLQQGSKADYDIITPIEKDAVKNYEKKLEAHKWTYGKDPPVYPEPSKDSVFQLTIRNNWQGLAYMMLEVARLPMMDAFKAGVSENKMNLLWTLLKKQRNASDITTRDADNQTLLHILTKHATSNDYSQVADGETKIIDQKSPDIEMGDEEAYVPNKNHIEIAKLLLKAGLKVSDVDNNKSTPLHNAAKNLNFVMTKLLLENAPHLINVRDSNNQTPLASVICACRKNSDITFKDGVLIKFLVNNDAEINISYNDNDGNETTLINDLVKLGDIGDFRDYRAEDKVTLFKYFFKHKLDVNHVVKGGPSALITAISHNDTDLAKLLVRKKASLDYCDKDGKNCIHHCVQSAEYASYENEELLKRLLVQKDCPINAKTLRGETPLDIANQMFSGTMANILSELNAKTSDGSCDYLYKPREDEFLFLDNSVPEILSSLDIDIINHSENEIKQGISEQDIRDEDLKVKPDPALNMDENGEVYCDPDTDVPYDVLLSKIDVRWGTWGLNLHYKLQVVYHKGRDLWILFNMWGRPGGDSQHQQTPYNTPTDAVTEFKRIFKSKTGNTWDDVDNFQRKPKKYAIVLNERNPEKVLKHQKGVLKPFNLKESADSKLPKDIQDFMLMICSSQDVLDLGSRFMDQSYAPIDLVKLENIQKALDILKKIKVLIERCDTTDDMSDEEKTKHYMEISELSNDYYMLVPPRSYSYTRIPPISTAYSVEYEERNMKYLIELNPIVKIMIAAQHKSKEISPLDYCFKALDCKLEMMKPTCIESQLILKYLFNTTDTDLSRSFNITGIYRYEKKSSDYQDHLPIKYLLWHGTENEHLLGILQQGLKVDPPYANYTGHAYGNGIYFSYSFHKSSGYSSWGTGFVLLCEVASKGFFYPKNCQCDHTTDTWLRTSYIPDPVDTLTMPYGAKIFQGKLVEDEKKYDDDMYTSYENEVIVRNAEQVKIRYIVRYDRK